jgi:phenylalanine-4-hydroxylase
MCILGEKMENDAFIEMGVTDGHGDITTQNMGDLTEEDHAVWKILCSRQSHLSQGKASVAFNEGLRSIGFSQDSIPNFAEMSKKTMPLTGMKIIPVTGLIPTKKFFTMLSDKKFPCTLWIRKRDRLDYIEEPDLFHDVFGHAPILTDRVFADFIQGFAQLALKHVENERAIMLLARIWWFTFEFGLITEMGKEGKGEKKIFGGGILSSKSEVEHALSATHKHKPFNVREVMMTAYQIDRFQENYFIIDSFEQLLTSLPEIERQLDDLLVPKIVA